MKSRDFDYPLPPELIAQAPAPSRDGSRLMVAARNGGPLEHRSFADLPRFLRPGDLLVLNDTRVVPARLMLTRSTGGKVEALLLPGGGEALLDSGGRLKPGESLRLEDGSACTLGNRRGEAWEVTFEGGR